MSSSYIPPTIVILFATILGDFGNINIIWATIRKKSLQSPCNILIAANALADSTTQIGHFIFAYFIFSGVLYTDKMSCFYWMALSQLGSSLGICFTLAIGVDRLIGVMAPVKYKSLKRAYIFLILFIPLLCSLANLYLSYFHLKMENPENTTVICFVSLSYPSGNSYINNIQAITLSAAIILSYALTWFFLWKKKFYGTMKHIMKALTVIMFIVILNWPLIILIWIMVLKYVSVQDFLLVNLYTSFFYNFSVGAHYFIFFSFSREYRKAFLDQLFWIPFLKSYAKKYRNGAISISYVSQTRQQKHVRAPKIEIKTSI